MSHYCILGCFTPISFIFPSTIVSHISFISHSFPCALLHPLVLCTPVVPSSNLPLYLSIIHPSDIHSPSAIVSLSFTHAFHSFISNSSLPCTCHPVLTQQCMFDLSSTCHSFFLSPLYPWVLHTPAFPFFIHHCVTWVFVHLSFIPVYHCIFWSLTYLSFISVHTFVSLGLP